MKKLIVAATLVIVFAFIVLAVYAADQPEKAAPSPQFACPMHADIIAAWAAKCPKCGMALVKSDAKPDEKPASLPFACPMHPDVKATWAAKCPKCGMEIVKSDAKPAAKMMEQCKAMMEQKQKMMADMKAQDAKLTEQVAEMNRAPQDKKVDLMAALLTNMVQQRIAMEARMMKMHEEMMQHMMQHMMMGKDSMSQCPMMKGMSDKPAGTQ